MKNVDLEKFYSNANTAIEIAAAYIGQPALKKLIISCRLKPITIFSNTFKPNELECWWVDEFGNSIILEKNQIRVVKQDSNIRHNTQISTDLFFGRSIVETLKISRGVTLRGDFLIFYGEDEYFRCFNKTNGKKISPLEIEIDELIDIQRNVHSRYKLPNDEIEVTFKKEFAQYE